MPSASKNIFWLTVSRAVALVLLAVAYFALFRYLGKFGTGQHQFVLSFTTIFGVVVDFGIQQYIIKKISEHPGAVKKYFHNFLVTEIVIALIVYAIMLCVAFAAHYDHVVIMAIAVAGVGMMTNALTYPFLSVMSAFQDLRKVAIINFMNSFVNFAIIILAITFHKYIVFLVSNQFIFGVLGLILYYQFVKKHIPHPDVLQALRFPDFKLIKTILKAALPFALLVGFSTIYNRIDTVLIYRFLGADQTGLYAAAYKFFDLIAFFPSVVSFTLYPLFAGFMAQNAIVQVRANIEKYLRLMLALALPMGVGGSILAGLIISLVAGKEFAAAAPVLAVLVWAPAILFIYIVANALVISQLTKFAVIITGVNVFINIIGNVLLLRHFGIMAAAIMTVVSEFLQGVFYFYFIRKKITSFSFVGLAWRPLVASAVMGIALWYARNFSFVSGQQGTSYYAALILTFGVLVGGGALIYILALWLLGFFKKEDTHFIKSFFNRNSAPVNDVQGII